MRPGDGVTYPVLEYARDTVRLYTPSTGRVVSARRPHEVLAELGPNRTVVLALSRRSSFVRSTRLPDVDKGALSAILGLQVGQLFPLAPSDLAFDAAPAEDKNTEGRLATIAAVKTELLSEALAALKEAGIGTAAVLPAAWSSARIARSAGLSDCAVVGHGPEGLTIDLVQGGAVVQSRTVPAQESATAVASEVAQSLEAAQMSDVEVLCAPGVPYPGGRKWDDEPLAALSNGPFELFLELPEAKLAKAKKEEHKRKNLALLLWVAALGVGAVVYDIRSSEAETVKKADKKWAGRLKTIRSDNSLAQSRATELRSVKGVVDVAFAPKQPLSDVTTVLSNLSPPSLWLTGVSVERGKRATVRGTATNGQAVSAYLTSLGRQSRLRDIKLVFANNALIEKTPVVNFSVSMHVVGNFPLPEKAAGGAVARRS
ncbi:MAG: PilN domain-containing protein [Armatimonadetes bacterium]|nr:PilN domain-containing protein [Armatimonadota bacterium]